MNHKLYLFCFGIFLSLGLQAQYETVVYDYSKNWFGENQALPAEKQWMLTGPIPDAIRMVELQIFQPGNNEDRFLFRSDFQKAPATSPDNFNIPVNFKLRGNTAYNLKILYFEDASDDDMRMLSQMVSQSLNAYLNQSMVAGRRQVSLAKHPRLMRQELDLIVIDGLALYRNRMGIRFEGFSDIVYEKLQRIDELNLREARFNVLRQNDSNQETRVTYFQQNVQELAEMLEREVNNYLSGNFYVLREARSITNYKSESTRWTLPINLGYAAVLDNVTNDGFAVEGAPMVGISVPLGNPNFAGNFWSNSSVSFGALLRNVTFDNEFEYTGPLVNTPLYLAYGYKTAYFLRINVGTAILQEVGSNSVHLSPFVGLSVELNLWLGLNK